MTLSDDIVAPLAAAEERALWRRQASTLPALRGGKRVWFALVVELVEQIGAGRAITMEARPDIPLSIFSQATRRAGAPPAIEPLTWLEYARFLKAVGLAQISDGALNLTAAGQTFQATPAPEALASNLAVHFRLFAESLAFLAARPSTVEEVDTYLRNQYGMAWKSLGGTRERLDWLEALGLIEGAGSRKWKMSATGEKVLASCALVSPQAITPQYAQSRPILEAPGEIKNLLAELSSGARTQESRSTYNIWVPAPSSRPNKVENLRTILNATLDPISRVDLSGFIAETFELRRSSVDSMMPFLRASGLLHEIGLGIYQATSPAKAWIASNDDVNFIRILHANMRFVGEMIRTVETGVTRSEMYRESAKYGLNVDKSRWIASFLEDAGLVEKPRYGSIRATPAGIALMPELPLASTPPIREPEQAPSDVRPESTSPLSRTRTDELVMLAQSPQALNKGSGKAFENAICDAFRAMGFHARTVSGSGDTDIVVRWRDESDAEVVAIVEAKSRTNGHVAHTDISDVALETHKSQHHASLAAVVGPAFAGDTIKNMAAKRKWALVEARRLGDIVEAATELGLNPNTIGLLFSVPDGLEELAEVIKQRRRELAVVSFVMTQLTEELSDTGDVVTARDISRDGRRTELQPTSDEVIQALSLVTRTAADAIRVVERQDDAKFSTYALGDVKSAAARLRALADAIETA